MNRSVAMALRNMDVYKDRFLKLSPLLETVLSITKILRELKQSSVPSSPQILK